MTARILLWFERSLLAVGLALGLWCGKVLLEASYYASLPIPAARATTLPGDAGENQQGRSLRTPLERGAWIARLEAPRLGLSATILEGSDDGTLSRAAGHIEDTPLPGADGNVGIAGHRDTTFRPIQHVKAGDLLRLTTADRVYDYRVVSTTVVNPTDVHVLDPTGQPTLTLVTCYPFTFVGSAPKRFIVKAELVSRDARAPSPPR